MKNIVILDTTVGSMNVGDNVIKHSIDIALNNLYRNNHVRSFPTRTIAFPWYQMKVDSRVNYVTNADYKFVCGTNLLHSCMAHIVNQWNINLFNYKTVKNAILLGVGGEKGKRIYLDPYTRWLYKKVLSSEYIHSVRDERTKKILDDLGIDSINTGCPTLWGFNKEFCKSIPTKKSNKVIFTLHHGRRDINGDQKLIDIINNNYEEVYFFPQTPYDVEYVKSFHNISHIKILPSNLEAYTNILNGLDIDYVGIRLHGGIYAMQHKKRAILIMVDERMRDINRSNGLNCIDRDNLEKLEDMINSEFETKVIINQKAIDTWLGQFNE